MTQMSLLQIWQRNQSVSVMQSLKNKKRTKSRGFTTTSNFPTSIRNIYFHKSRPAVTTSAWSGFPLFIMSIYYKPFLIYSM